MRYCFISTSLSIETVATQVVTITAKFRRQIRIQIQIAYERSVRFRMAFLACILSPNPAMCGSVSHWEMALLAEPVSRLSQQPVIIAAVRIVAARAAAALERVCIHGFVLIEKGAPLFRMTILTRAFQSVGQVVITFFDEPMTVEARYILLEKRMVRIFREMRFGVFVAAKTKLGIIVQQQGCTISMNFMTIRATEFLDGMRIKAVIIKFGMGRVALGTDF